MQPAPTQWMRILKVLHFIPAEWGVETAPQVGVLSQGCERAGCIATALMREHCRRKCAVHTHRPLRTHTLLAVKHLQVKVKVIVWSFIVTKDTNWWQEMLRWVPLELKQPKVVRMILKVSEKTTLHLFQLKIGCHIPGPWELCFVDSEWLASGGVKGMARSWWGRSCPWPPRQCCTSAGSPVRGCL